jgi:hypothetical protein
MILTVKVEIIEERIEEAASEDSEKINIRVEATTTTTAVTVTVVDEIEIMMTDVGMIVPMNVDRTTMARDGDKTRVWHHLRLSLRQRMHPLRRCGDVMWQKLLRPCHDQEIIMIDPTQTHVLLPPLVPVGKKHPFQDLETTRIPNFPVPFRPDPLVMGTMTLIVNFISTKKKEVMC